MSVFILSPEAFGVIAATLRVSRDSLRRPLFPLSMAERWEHKAMIEPYLKQSEEEYTLSLIAPFVYRLYIANVMAERYTDMKDGMSELTIPLIDLPEGHPVDLRKLLKILGSLSYNLVTKGGNTFLGIKDDEKLRQLIDNIKSELLHAESKAA